MHCQDLLGTHRIFNYTGFSYEYYETCLAWPGDDAGTTSIWHSPIHYGLHLV